MPLAGVANAGYVIGNTTIMSAAYNGLNWTNILEYLIGALILAGVLCVTRIIWRNRRIISVWLRRQKLRHFPTNFNVALSLEFKEGLNSGNYYDQIKKNLITLIDETGMKGQVVLKDFSDIKIFNNKNEAESFRNRKGTDLIIWGSFSNDALKSGGEAISELKLHFTYGYPENKDKAVGKLLILDISSSMAKKNYWKIIESSSFEDTKIVSKNIFDIATYILALTLKLYGRIGKSLSLFEKLYTNLVSGNDDFHKDIIPHLHNCYQLLIIENSIFGKDYNVGVELCDNIMQLDPSNFFGLTNKAVFLARLGKTKEAESVVEKLLVLYPKKPVTEVDAAYIRILQKNYTNAFKHYKRLAGLRAINFNSQDVIEFLGGEYDKTKEPALLFGMGMVSCYFGDQVLAKNSFEQFIRKAREQDYKPMYREAKRILKKL